MPRVFPFLYLIPLAYPPTMEFRKIHNARQKEAVVSGFRYGVPLTVNPCYQGQLTNISLKLSQGNKMYQPLEITRVHIPDVRQLQAISMDTFTEAFSADNSAENMRQYLDKAFSIEKLQSEIQDPNTRFYFALNDKKVIGYLKINFGTSQTVPQDEKAVEIERIYLSSAFYGKNIGQQLIAKAIEIARQADAPFIWLGVWEHNPRAIRFYSKNGFVAFDEHLFMLGEEAQRDLLMKRLL